MQSVQVASKNSIPTGSVNKSRDRVVCAVKQVLCGVFVMLSTVLYLSFEVK